MQDGSSGAHDGVVRQGRVQVAVESSTIFVNSIAPTDYALSKTVVVPISQIFVEKEARYCNKSEFFEVVLKKSADSGVDYILPQGRIRVSVTGSNYIRKVGFDATSITVQRSSERVNIPISMAPELEPLPNDTSPGAAALVTASMISSGKLVLSNNIELPLTSKNYLMVIKPIPRADSSDIIELSMSKICGLPSFSSTMGVLEHQMKQRGKSLEDSQKTYDNRRLSDESACDFVQIDPKRARTQIQIVNDVKPPTITAVLSSQCHQRDKSISMTVKRSGWLKCSVTVYLNMTKNKTEQVGPVEIQFPPNHEEKAFALDISQNIVAQPTTLIEVTLACEGEHHPVCETSHLRCIITNCEPETVGFKAPKHVATRSQTYIDIPIVNPREYYMTITLHGGRTGQLKTNQQFIRIPIDSSIPKDDEIDLSIGQIRTQDFFNLGFTSTKLIIENDLLGPEISISSVTRAQEDKVLTVAVNRAKNDTLSQSGWVKLSLSIRSTNSNLIARYSDSEDYAVLMLHGVMSTCIEIPMLQSSIECNDTHSMVNITVTDIESEFDNAKMAETCLELAIENQQGPPPIQFEHSTYRVNRTDQTVDLTLTPAHTDYALTYKVKKCKSSLSKSNISLSRSSLSLNKSAKPETLLSTTGGRITLQLPQKAKRESSEEWVVEVVGVNPTGVVAYELNKRKCTAKVLISNDVPWPYIELIPEKAATEVFQSDGTYNLKYVPRGFEEGETVKVLVKAMTICSHGANVYKFDEDIKIPIDQRPPSEEDKGKPHEVQMSVGIVGKELVKVKPEKWSIFINQDKKKDYVSFEPKSEVVVKRSQWNSFNPRSYLTDQIHDIPISVPEVELVPQQTAFTDIVITIPDKEALPYFMPKIGETVATEGWFPEVGERELKVTIENDITGAILSLEKPSAGAVYKQTTGFFLLYIKRDGFTSCSCTAKIRATLRTAPHKQGQTRSQQRRSSIVGMNDGTGEMVYTVEVAEESKLTPLRVELDQRPVKDEYIELDLMIVDGEGDPKPTINTEENTAVIRILANVPFDEIYFSKQTIEIPRSEYSKFDARPYCNDQTHEIKFKYPDVELIPMEEQTSTVTILISEAVESRGFYPKITYPKLQVTLINDIEWNYVHFTQPTELITVKRSEWAHFNALKYTNESSRKILLKTEPEVTLEPMFEDTTSVKICIVKVEQEVGFYPKVTQPCLDVVILNDIKYDEIGFTTETIDLKRSQWGTLNVSRYLNDQALDYDVELEIPVVKQEPAPEPISLVEIKMSNPTPPCSDRYPLLKQDTLTVRVTNDIPGPIIRMECEQRHYNPALDDHVMVKFTRSGWTDVKTCLCLSNGDDIIFSNGMTEVTHKLVLEDNIEAGTVVVISVQEVYGYNYPGVDPAHDSIKIAVGLDKDFISIPSEFIVFSSDVLQRSGIRVPIKRLEDFDLRDHIEPTVGKIIGDEIIIPFDLAQLFKESERNKEHVINNKLFLTRSGKKLIKLENNRCKIIVRNDRATLNLARTYRDKVVQQSEQKIHLEVLTNCLGRTLLLKCMQLGYECEFRDSEQTLTIPISQEPHDDIETHLVISLHKCQDTGEFSQTNDSTEQDSHDTSLLDACQARLIWNLKPIELQLSSDAQPVSGTTAKPHDDMDQPASSGMVRQSADTVTFHIQRSRYFDVPITLLLRLSGFVNDEVCLDDVTGREFAVPVNIGDGRATTGKGHNDTILAKLYQPDVYKEMAAQGAECIDHKGLVLVLAGSLRLDVVKQQVTMVNVGADDYDPERGIHESFKLDQCFSNFAIVEIVKCIFS